MNNDLKRELKKHCEANYKTHNDYHENKSETVCMNLDCEFIVCKSDLSCYLSRKVEGIFGYPKDWIIETTIQAFLSDNFTDIDVRVAGWLESLTNGLNDGQTLDKLEDLKLRSDGEKSRFTQLVFDLFNDLKRSSDEI